MRAKKCTILVLASNIAAACARTTAENRATEFAMSLAHCSVISGADAFCAAPPLKAGSAPFCSHVNNASSKSSSCAYASNESSVAIRSSLPNVRESSASDACSHGSDAEGEEEAADDEDEDGLDERTEAEQSSAISAEIGVKFETALPLTAVESVVIRGAKFLYDVGS